MNLKLSQTSSLSRSLLAATTLISGLTMLAPSTAHAQFLNYYRDYVSYISDADWNDANTEANVDDAGGAASSIVPAAYPWMTEPLTAIAQARSGYRYAYSYIYEGDAYYKLYLYYAFSFPDYLDYYTSIAAWYADQYYQAADAWGDFYQDEIDAGAAEWSAAVASAQPDVPADANNYPNVYLRVALYGGPWLANDADYAFQKASYNYNLWASYGAPYYSLSMWYSGVVEYYGGIADNLYDSIYYNTVVYPDESDAIDAADAATEPYYENAEYWSYWAEYYRVLSDFYEG